MPGMARHIEMLNLLAMWVKMLQSQFEMVRSAIKCRKALSEGE